MIKYNIVFVPKLKDRKHLTKIRNYSCKLISNNIAKFSPIHMSLISGGFETKNVKDLEKELKLLCKNIKKIKLDVSKNIEIMKNISWYGINVKRNKEIKKLQIILQNIRNKYSLKKGIHEFRDLHITLAWKGDVSLLKNIKNPLKELVVDRITIIKKKDKISPYRIYKHINFV